MEANERNDAEYLKDLRLSAGFNIAQLAAMANLSAGQLRQLEEGGDNLFYSPQIKAQSMRRVIRMLENPVPVSSPTKVVAEESVPRANVNVIDDIIRLSEKNLSGNVVTSKVRRPGRMGGILSVFVLVAVILLVFFGWQSSQEVAVSKFTEWVNPSGLRASLEQPASSAFSAQDTVAAQHTQAEAGNVDSVSTVGSATPVAKAPSSIKTLPADKPDMQIASIDKRECANINAQAITVSAHSVSKPANYVYVQANQPVQLCVDDGKLNRTVLNLDSGAGRSVHGSPPWTISSYELSSVNIYFQGSKLALPANVGQRIYLAEQVVSR
ncbi:MAG: hypothetical protein ACKO5X_02965 [Limnohabitans sp.]